MDNNKHERVTKPIPTHNRKLIFSLNIMSAIIAVVTISKLLSNDAFADEVLFNPNNKKIGAAISNNIMAIVNGNSDFVKCASFVSI